ncbi:uncharacterized protein LOC143288787 [Babylonia areolata]|uniref:uncharacterized protein LOC143288787 n=1 Tax=Babylonia areolata TaxID=304850 RepID=UPI003FD30864
MGTYGPALLVVLGLAATLGSTSGHEHVHEKQHSHLCEGAGYNLFCPEGQEFKVYTAWYGRLAHDTTSCTSNVQSPTPNTNTTTTNTTTNTASSPLDLPEDCGSSVLDSKDSWCQNSDKGGCSIAVKNLAPEVEGKECPDGVMKYLYLEYQCLGSGGSGGGVSAFAASSGTRSVVLSLMTLTAVYLSF